MSGPTRGSSTKDLRRPSTVSTQIFGSTYSRGKGVSIDLVTRTLYEATEMWEVEERNEPNIGGGADI